MTFILIGAILAIVFIALWGTRPSRDNENQEWSDYLESVDGVERLLGQVAQPLAGTGLVQKAIETPAYRKIRTRLVLGQTFGGSVEVFTSVQFTCLAISSASLLTAILVPLPTLPRILLGLFALIIAVWPSNHVRESAKKRSAAITVELPDFADLLVMALPGMSVISAMSFTSDHVKGVVASEIRELVTSLHGRNINQSEAFDITAQRLGTNEGIEFVRALQNAYIEGTKVIETLTTLAETMRKVAYQQQRAVIKKLPVKLVVVFALHFMPLLFVLSFLPVITGLGSLG